MRLTPAERVVLDLLFASPSETVPRKTLVAHLTQDQARLIEEASGIAKSADGRPLVSSELAPGRLMVVGRNPSASVRALQSEDGRLTVTTSGAAMNVPGVVARAVYEKRCVPSVMTMAKASVRLSRMLT